MDTEAHAEGPEAASSDASKMETNDGEGQEAADKDKAAAGPAKQILKAVPLQVDSKTTSMPQQLLHDLTEREVNIFFKTRRHLYVKKRIFHFCRLDFNRWIMKNVIELILRMR